MMPAAGYDISIEQSAAMLATFHFVRPRPAIHWQLPQRDYARYRINIGTKIEAPERGDMISLSATDQRLLEKALLASTESLYEF